MKKLLSTMTTAFFMFTSTVSAAPMTLNVHDADLRSTIILVARAGGLNGNGNGKWQFGENGLQR